MPVTWSGEPRATLSQPNFFKDLSGLDEWASKPKHQSRLHGLLEYSPRSKVVGSEQENRGNLLVCHDYKGGYNEGSSSLAYTFNFWDQCDTFIYFSHHRVSIPPPGWVNAAHRQGVKILGVLIFEHKESMEDTLRLLLGNLPKARTGPPNSLISNGIPVSQHYARLLSNLAYERGFDGYLLNFEFSFPGRSEEARAVEAWISLLKYELKRKVGNYAQTIWYDSIITTGDLRWQDRLNSRNISFFLASDAFFTNYTWPTHFPSFSAQYLLGLAPELFQGKNKTLRDIYVGIDVWGRGSHGGGGLGAFRAIEHIDPVGLGLSVALFGQGWTWESDEDKEGWNWEQWWSRERTLWVGPEIQGAHVEVPDAPLHEGERPCPHGDFKPLGNFFHSASPPNPDVLPFCTTFCPGVGYAWFVEGRRVMYKESGWTDIDKQKSMGNLLWPRPRVEWEGTDPKEMLPKASTALIFDDAFNGGSCVTLTLAGEGAGEAEPSFHCFWIPVQSVTLTSGKTYETELIYKVTSGIDEFDLALSVKGDEEIEITPASSTELENGWSRVSITCKPRARLSADSNSDILAKLGVVLALASDDGSLPYNISVHLGQLSVYPRSALSDPSPFSHRLLWADCSREPNSSNTLLLTWDACISYNNTAIIRPADIVPEVARPPWTLDHSPDWYPRLAYANVYAEAHGIASASEVSTRPGTGAVFLGTSGWGCGATTGAGPNAFALEKDGLPEVLRDRKVRFYVQGVTDRGVVLPWESCAFVDFDW